MAELTFSASQLVSSSTVAKKFGTISRRAKERPQFVVKNNQLDLVILSYRDYEAMYKRLINLEEEQLLVKRVEELEKDPSIGIPWEHVRSEENTNG